MASGLRRRPVDSHALERLRVHGGADATPLAVWLLDFVQQVAGLVGRV